MPKLGPYRVVTLVGVIVGIAILADQLIHSAIAYYAIVGVGIVVAFAYGFGDRLRR